MYHTDKNGEKTKISDLETSHLINIIKFIERKAEEGIIIRFGGGTTPDDCWYDEDHLFGETAKKHLKYKYYVKELRNREDQTNTVKRNESTLLRIEEICKEFDNRVAAVGLAIARLELAKRLAESENKLLKLNKE